MTALTVIVKDFKCNWTLLLCLTLTNKKYLFYPMLLTKRFFHFRTDSINTNDTANRRDTRRFSPPWFGVSFRTLNNRFVITLKPCCHFSVMHAFTTFIHSLTSQVVLQDLELQNVLQDFSTIQWRHQMIFQPPSDVNRRFLDHLVMSSAYFFQSWWSVFQNCERFWTCVS